MKRFIIFIVLASFVVAACGGSPSLWGQYQTPTPPAGVQSLSSPIPEIIPTNTATPVAPPTVEVTSTPTLINEAFVTQEVASQIESTPASVGNNPTILYYTQSGDWLPR